MGKSSKLDSGNSGAVKNVMPGVKSDLAKFRAALERIAALDDAEPGTAYANADPRRIAKEALGIG